MAKKKATKKRRKLSGWGIIGAWSFIIGLIVALLMGIFSSTQIPNSTTTIVLLVLGLIVGLLNINDKEIMPFLIAGIAFMLAATISTVVPFPWIPRVMANIAVFILPAVVVGSFKAIYILAKD